MKKYYIQTFGCAMNQADSEKINMILLQSGFVMVKNWQDADLVIFNTCSVRQKGEDKVFGFLTEIYKENNNILVGITGCMVRKTGINGKYLENYKRDKNKAKNITVIKEKSAIFNNDDKLFPRGNDRLDFVLRIEDSNYLPFILSHILGENIGNDYILQNYLKTKQLRENPASATIIIQTGCDNYCTYCIVPYTRGHEKSRSIIDIVNEATDAVKSGAKEITLVGQNVNSFGKQWINSKYWDSEKNKWNDGLGKSPFRKLLEEINKIEGLDRIRFTSSNPHDMTQDILDAYFELDKMCNYLHFALQSGSDEMLKKMNRRHKYSDFKKMVDYLRLKDPLFAISTDIIVGFSGETEEMFQKTVKAFNECEFDFTYNARYSIRKGTIAAKIYPDDISNEVKAERWHKLNDILLKNVQKRNKLMLNREEEVLISAGKEGNLIGRTRNFKEVRFKGNKRTKIGDLVKVKIVEIDRYILKGIII